MIGIRETRFLLQADSALGPIQRGGDIKVDVERVVIVEVDCVVELGKLFDSAAGAHQKVWSSVQVVFQAPGDMERK